ncbi:MAG: hypothetical protein JW917_00840 [Ignavibacteria bacterium]|nr:hypothetical protein [Ignavibacteria bacterium]
MAYPGTNDPTNDITILKNYEMVNYNSISPQLNKTSKIIHSFVTNLKIINYGNIKEIETIVITCQKGDQSAAHITDKATDICCLPLWTNVVLWTYLNRAFPFNVFLSIHNRHIHIDQFYNNYRNRKLIENYDFSSGKFSLEEMNKTNWKKTCELYDIETGIFSPHGTELRLNYFEESLGEDNKYLWNEFSVNPIDEWFQDKVYDTIKPVNDAIEEAKEKVKTAANYTELALILGVIYLMRNDDARNRLIGTGKKFINSQIPGR